MQANRKRNFQLNEHRVTRIHDYLYSRQKYPLVFLNLAIYATIILTTGEYFKISANYFIILPLIVISISFGLWGGLIAGVLALPANLFLFYIIGHLEYAPESLIMAELTGIVLGTILGFLSDFFTQMKREMRRRWKSELALEKSLKEKEILLQEINHRVKNNLNLIKSIIQLQSNRLPQKEINEEMIKLRDRVLSIALVQDQLYSQESLDLLDLKTYMENLSRNLLKGFHDKQIELVFNCEENPIMLESRKVTSLGIITNEVLTNISKYAIPDEGKCLVSISLKRSEDEIHIIFKDSGPGYGDTGESTGLGFKLIRSLISSLNGHMEIKNNKGGELILHFPADSRDY